MLTNDARKTLQHQLAIEATEYRLRIARMSAALERAGQSLERAPGYGILCEVQSLDVQTRTLEWVWGIQTPAGLVATRDPQRVVDLGREADKAYYDSLRTL